MSLLLFYCYSFEEKPWPRQRIRKSIWLGVCSQFQKVSPSNTTWGCGATVSFAGALPAFCAPPWITSDCSHATPDRENVFGCWVNSSHCNGEVSNTVCYHGKIFERLSRTLTKHLPDLWAPCYCDPYSVHRVPAAVHRGILSNCLSNPGRPLRPWRN